MATLSDLFGTTQPQAAAGAPPEPTPDATGAPPGDQRYGKGMPLSDQFAGKTLAQLLEDAGERVDPAEYMTKYIKPEKPPIYSGVWGKTNLFFRNTAKTGNPTPQTLLVIPAREAQAFLKGEAPEQPLVGGQEQAPV